MNAAVIIIDIILILIAALLILIVLMQEGQSQGLGAIAGGAETFLGKNKAKSLQGRLSTITKIAATVFIVLAIVTTILVSHQKDSSNVTNDHQQEVVDTTDDANDGETANDNADDGETANDNADDGETADDDKSADGENGEDNTGAEE